MTTAIKKPTPKEGPFDITKRVEVTITDKHPFHPSHMVGKTVRIAPLIAEKYRLNGWGK